MINNNPYWYALLEPGLILIVGLCTLLESQVEGRFPIPSLDRSASPSCCCGRHQPDIVASHPHSPATKPIIRGDGGAGAVPRLFLLLLLRRRRRLLWRQSTSNKRPLLLGMLLLMQLLLLHFKFVLLHWVVSRKVLVLHLQCHHGVVRLRLMLK